MASVAGRVLIARCRVTHAKRHLKTEAALLRTLPAQPAGGAQPPAWLRRLAYPIRTEVGGYPCYTFTPRAGYEREVLYLHGGGYVHDAGNAHWLLTARLLRALNCRLTFPIYPLAPGHTYEAAHSMVLDAYRHLLSRSAASEITVMGDSAGGGLCLALCQLIRAAGLAQPAHAILLSPWLDLAMSAPGLEILERVDPILAAPGLIAAGRLWAGATPVSDPLLSPLNADFAGIAPITIFVGTRDLLVLDGRRLRDRMAAQGTRLGYFEYAGMFHVFAAFPIPEGVRVMRRIKEIVGA
jgi:monoterpene epsilon-lactone hydrolase